MTEWNLFVINYNVNKNVWKKLVTYKNISIVLRETKKIKLEDITPSNIHHYCQYIISAKFNTS